MKVTVKNDPTHSGGRDVSAGSMTVRATPSIHETDLRALAAMLNGGNGLYMIVVHNGRIQKGPTRVPRIDVIDDAVALLEAGGSAKTKPRRSRKTETAGGDGRSVASEEDLEGPIEQSD